MNELISEFFTDGICRLIPGSVFMALYGYDLIVRAHRDFSDSSVLLATCFFFIAWLIGVLWEIATSAPFFIIFWSLKYFEYPWLYNLFLPACKKIPSNETNPQAVDRRAEHRQCACLGALRVLYRVMIFISIFTYFSPPTIFQSDQWWHKSYGVYGIIIFSFGWVWAFLSPIELRKKTQQ
jgi:hypothetical protein